MCCVVRLWLIGTALACRTQLEIMVPLVAFESELQSQAALVRKVAAAVFEEKGKKIDFKVGTMIETPRAGECWLRVAAS